MTKDLEKEYKIAKQLYLEAKKEQDELEAELIRLRDLSHRHYVHYVHLQVEYLEAERALKKDLSERGELH